MQKRRRRHQDGPETCGARAGRRSPLIRLPARRRQDERHRPHAQLRGGTPCRSGRNRVPSHKVSGQITLYCIEGHAQLGLTGETIDLRAGDWVYLEGDEPHSVKGIEDASLLLNILFLSNRNVQDRQDVASTRASD